MIRGGGKKKKKKKNWRLRRRLVKESSILGMKIYGYMYIYLDIITRRSRGATFNTTLSSICRRGLLTHTRRCTWHAYTRRAISAHAIAYNKHNILSARSKNKFRVEKEEHPGEERGAWAGGREEGRRRFSTMRVNGESTT